MTFRILYLAYRKPGTTPAQFRAHYDERHMPNIKAMAGPLFPLSHVRRYVHRADTGTTTTTITGDHYPATLLSGAQAAFAFDAVVEMAFADAAAFAAFCAVLREPANAAWIARDEAAFLDRDRVPAVAVLGHVTRTER